MENRIRYECSPLDEKWHCWGEKCGGGGGGMNWEIGIDVYTLMYKIYTIYTLICIK